MNALTNIAAQPGTAIQCETSTVVVVDGDVSVREPLAQLVRAAGWQPQPFASAQEFLAWPRADGPVCLILDVTLPDLNGLELQTLIADRTEMPVIFISGCGDVRTIVRAMKAGAVEFLTKPFRKEVMLRAMECALDRSRVLIEEEAKRRALRARYASLSARERQVMSLVVQGVLNKVIAAELCISEITVKVHRGRMMRKMMVRCLPELVYIADRLGLPSARERPALSERRAIGHLSYRPSAQGHDSIRGQALLAGG